MLDDFGLSDIENIRIAVCEARRHGNLRVTIDTPDLSAILARLEGSTVWDSIVFNPDGNLTVFGLKAHEWYFKHLHMERELQKHYEDFRYGSGK